MSIHFHYYIDILKMILRSFSSGIDTVVINDAKFFIFISTIF